MFDFTDAEIAQMTDDQLEQYTSLMSDKMAFDAEDSLFMFYKNIVWPAVEGDRPFVDNWHLRAMAEHLEAVSAGKIRRLLINVPFRTSKSTLVSVAWPAWVWLKNPSYQWLCGSYAEKLAIRDSLKMRRVITSPLFLKHWGDRFTLAGDQNAKEKFETDRGGYRQAFGMTGGVMGSGGDCFDYNTLLQTENGLREIGEIVDNKEQIKVWSTHPETLVTSLKDVTNWYRRPGSEMIAIGLPDGHIIRCTPNHLILTTVGWVEAGKLSVHHTLPCSAGRKSRPNARYRYLSDAELSRDILACVSGRSDLRDLALCELTVGVVRPTPVEPNPNTLGHIAPCFSNLNIVYRGFGNVVSGCKKGWRLSGLGDLYDFFCGKFSSWCGNTDTLSNMRPLDTSTDRLNRSGGYVMFQGQLLDGSIGGVNRSCLILGELGTGVGLTSRHGAVSQGVRHIDSMCGVGQIIKSWVLSVTVKMSNLVTFWSGSDKGLHDHHVNGEHGINTVGANAELGVLTTGGCTDDLPLNCGEDVISVLVSPPPYLSGDAAYASEIGHFIGGVTHYRKPHFVRVDGHDAATFCVDVEDNHTFNVSSSGIIAHNCVLLDDPHDRNGANSDAERENAIITFSEGIITRLNDPMTSPIVIIMQRLHSSDISGYVLRDKGVYDHLMLPMRFESSRRSTTSIGFKDPRKVEGELLWPERFPEKTVRELEVALGEYGKSGQLQQRPAPAGGGILKTSNFRLWPADKDIPDLFWVGMSLDTAFSEKQENDPSACTVWGIFEYEKKRHVLLLDAWAEHLSYPNLLERIIADWGARYGGIRNNPMKPSRKPDMILIEAKASGQSLIQSLRQSNIPVVPYNPGRADKISRAHLVAPILENDCVWVLESGKNRGRPRSWVLPFFSQCEQFPNDSHDDYVDTFTQMIRYLGDSGQLDIIAAPDDILEEKDYEREKQTRHKVNPYG